MTTTPDPTTPVARPAGGAAEGGPFLTLDELPLDAALNYRPPLWWRVRSWLRWRLAELVCAVRGGHRWETHGGKTWTDYGWEYDSHTECARCGASGEG